MAERQAERRVLFSISNMKKYFPLKKTKIFQQERLYVKANDGINLNIYEGETFGLVGESGCGKSTMGRVLLQLHSQTDGRSMYYGRDRSDLAPSYVAETLKDLKKLRARYEKLDQERIEYEKQYESLTTDEARWAATDKRREMNKRADDLYINVAKIIGGFIVCDNLDEVSEKFLAEYRTAVKVFRKRNEIDALKKEIDALNASEYADDAGGKKQSKDREKAKALEPKLATLQGELATLDVQRQTAQAAIDAMREKHRNVPGFAENEALLDSGIDLAQLTSEEMRILRKDMQLIFQDPYSSLNPRMTVAQLIGEGVSAHNIIHRSSPKMQEYVLSVMAQCGLAPYMMHRYPHQFSGGQRQRIGIARSLAVQPKFIVCDEAVSALDVSIQSQILNLLIDLKEEEGFTYLFISHDLSVIKYISDRIGVMYLGNLVELASSEELFRKPLHPYTEALLLAIPTTDVDAPRNIVPIEGDIPSPINPPSGCKFHTRCKYCMDVCRHVTPQFREVGPEHYVACHLRDPEYHDQVVAAGYEQA